MGGKGTTGIRGESVHLTLIHSFIQRLFIEHVLFVRASGAHRDEQNWIVLPWNRQPERENCNLGLNRQKAELPLRFSHPCSARFAHGKCYCFFALRSTVKAWKSPFPKEEVPCMASGAVGRAWGRGTGLCRQEGHSSLCSLCSHGLLSIAQASQVVVGVLSLVFFKESLHCSP